MFAYKYRRIATFTTTQPDLYVLAIPSHPTWLALICSNVTLICFMSNKPVSFAKGVLYSLYQRLKHARELRVKQARLPGSFVMKLQVLFLIVPESGP